MALATRCPSCGTRFRVASEQLRLRNGVVRCGECLHVFNAADRLDYVDANLVKLATITAVEAPANAEPEAESPREPEPETEPESQAPDLASQTPPTPPEHHPDSLSDLLPHAGNPPSFIRAQSFHNRPRHRWAALAVLLLASALLLQLAWWLHPVLIASSPRLKNTLDRVCASLPCRASLPQEAEYLAVVSSELQNVSGTSALQLDVVIRNRSGRAMALPALEVTLTDTQDHLLGRRIFMPADYQDALGSGYRSANGIGPDSDLPIHLVFTGPNSSTTGFLVYPFYP